MLCLSLSIVLLTLLMMNFASRQKYAQLSKVRNRMWTLSALLSTSNVVAGRSSINAFKVLNQFDVNEFGISGTRYKHIKSGAEVISIDAKDDNKVFGITFRTPPSDSSGVAHILEHSVLCGSRKYPTKEPFAHLLKSSLQNFLNAFTYPDRTCYPVASTNKKDFYNLVNVYLDAVLHPRALHDEKVFQQEGWHYELENIDAPLTLKGVVYNEMKGVYGSPDALLGRATQQALFTDNAYHVDSGGDPISIPKLCFTRFKEFHRSFYHPSNSRIFLYGDKDLDVDGRLTLLDDYLKEFDVDSQCAMSSKVEFQRKSPVILPKKKVPYAIDDSHPAGTGHMLTVNWLLNDRPLSTKETLLLGILDHLLLGTSSSSLRRILIESQLGEKVIGGGLSDELLQSTFAVGLKGVRDENVNTVENLILSTLNKLAEDGFDDDEVRASLNTVEFRLREFNTGGFPKGLSIMLGMMSRWIYDGVPEDAIRFEEPLRAIKKDIAEGRPIFQELLKQYLSKNTHRITVEMYPDANLEKLQRAEEETRMTALKSSLSPIELDEIIRTEKVLKEAQLLEDSVEAKQSLPTLELSDIDRDVKRIPSRLVEHDLKDECTILAHDLETSGIVYLDAVFDYSKVSLQDVELLPLFTRMILESGTTTRTDVELSRAIGTYTGGISLSFHNDVKFTPGTISDLDSPLLFIAVHGKAVSENVPHLMELLADVLLHAQLDHQQKAIEILKQNKANLESAVRSSGHAFASSRLAKDASLLGHIGETTGGLTAVRSAGGLLEQATRDWPTFHKRLENIRDTVIQRKGLVINLTANQDKIDSSVSCISNMLLNKLPLEVITSAPTHNHLVQQWKSTTGGVRRLKKREGFEIPTQVNYVAKGGVIMPSGSPVSGSDSVVTRYLSSGYLWDHIRVLGGAYGGFARFSDVSGRFTFLSYRDPNIVDSLRVYDGSAAVLTSVEIGEDELTQSIVGTIADLDKPMSPDQQGWLALTHYLSGETDKDRLHWRDQILSTSSSDFKKFAEKLAVLKEEGSVVVFGSKYDLEQANKLLPAHEQLALESALATEIVVDAVAP